MAVLTVTQLNRYAAFQLKEDRHLQHLLIRGEISGFTRNQRSGHCYFILKDAESSVRAVLFRNQASRISIPLANGISVIAAATATLYEREGTFQLCVTDLQMDGVGAQQSALEQRKKQLAALGVFDAARKRPLPDFPKKIGVVTSASGAAIHDIEQVIRRRFPLVQLMLFPAQVQGDSAPESISHAIQRASQSDCDILIVGRGGGSAEDLQAFQTEEVVMAVFHCSIPVISAVGHEIDQTLTDYAADLRAPTPSAAAELAVPSMLECAISDTGKSKTAENANDCDIHSRNNNNGANNKIIACCCTRKRIAGLKKKYRQIGIGYSNRCINYCRKNNFSCNCNRQN